MKRIIALLGGLLPGLLSAVKPKNIHDLDAKIETGYKAWKTVYGFLSDSAAKVEQAASDTAQAVMSALADEAAAPQADQAPAPPPAPAQDVAQAPAAGVHVTA